MSNDERRETVSYDDDKLHCWINGCQWVSITRVVQIRKDCNKETALSLFVSGCRTHCKGYRIC